MVCLFYSDCYSQNDTCAKSLAKLFYPVRFDKISVLKCCVKNSVVEHYGKGLYSEEGGHGGTSYWTDISRHVIMRVVWGVDWRADEISFSYGDKTDLPSSFTSINQLPDSAISSSINENLSLDGKIKLGMNPQEILENLGIPKSDTVRLGYRFLLYETDYEHTENVLFYEAIFKFKDNLLIRFSIYNGE
jgi:hypothetical protein